MILLTWFSSSAEEAKLTPPTAPVPNEIRWEIEPMGTASNGDPALNGAGSARCTTLQNEISGWTSYTTILPTGYLGYFPRTFLVLPSPKIKSFFPVKSG